MTLFELWAELSAQPNVGIQKRVYAKAKLKIYGSVDFSGKLGVSFEGPWEHQRIPSFAFISVLHAPDAEFHTLSLFLNEATLLPLFHVLCEDLVKVAMMSSTIDAVADQLEHWKLLLDDATVGEMSVLGARGLLGELLILKRLATGVGLTAAVAAWSGPLETPQDFYCGEFCVEVKTVGPGAKRLRINAVEQLEPSIQAQLFICQVVLEDFASEKTAVVSLSALIKDIRSHLVVGSETEARFAGLLQRIKYSDASDAARHPFTVQGIRVFEVVEGFPRMHSADILPGISLLRYEIDLSSIRAFEVAGLPGEGDVGS